MIDRNMKNDGNINTRLFNIIKSIPDSCIHSGDHQIGTPLSIYNVAFRKILSNAEKVFDSYYDCKNGKNDKNLNDYYVNYLESINEFLDGIYNIYKSMYTGQNVRKPSVRFSYQWLERNTDDNDIFSNYFEKIKDYKSHIGLIVNEIKHNQGVLASIKMNYRYGNILGYCVLAINALTATPNENIHPKHEGMATGNSFRYDMAYHFYNLYKVCDYASETIMKCIKRNYNFDVTYQPYEELGNTSLHRVFEKMAGMGSVYFPNEANAKKYSFAYSEGRLEIDVLPGRRLSWISEYSVSYMFSGDGATSSYKMPYI